MDIFHIFQKASQIIVIYLWFDKESLFYTEFYRDL